MPSASAVRIKADFVRKTAIGERVITVFMVVVSIA
jgi:hypothetical protein